MNGRTKGLVAVSAVAAAALAALIYFGGPGAVGGAGPGISAVDPTGAGTGLGDPNALRVEAVDFLTLTDDRESQFTADRIDPIDGQPFRFEVVQPVIRTYFKDTHQFMEVRAARGNLYAPNNDPQSGRLIGNVNVTVYAPPPNPDGTPNTPKWGTPADALLHVRLEEAEFDLQLGTLASRSPMDLYTREAEFHGVGLQLTFNERRNQLAFLRIDRGDFLRIHRAEAEAPADAVVAQAPASRSDAATPPRNLPRAQPHAESERSEGSDTDPPPTDDDLKPDQFYQATFEDNVRIASLDNAFRGRGDNMQLLFGLDPNDASDGPYGGLGFGPAPRDHTRVAHQPRSTTTTAPTQAPGMGVITPTGPRDIEVRWDGPLVVVPRPNQPDELLSARDFSLQLTGAPASLITDDGDTVDGLTIAYDKLRQRVRVQGGPDTPLRLASPEFGTLIARRLTLNRATGKGLVLGPIRLEADLDEDPDDDTPAERLVVTATERLDLAFDNQRPKRNDTDAERREAPDTDDLNDLGVGALRTIRFTGDVDVDHPRFAAGAGILQLTLQPGNAARATTLRRLNAQRDATLQVLGDPAGTDNDNAAWITGDDIAIAFETPPSPENDNARPQPRLVRAEGDVTLSQPGLLLDAQHLTATINNHAAPEGNEGSETNTQPTLASAHATGNIVGLLDASDTRDAAGVEADALWYTGDAQQLLLLGSTDQPARVRNADGDLAAPQLLLENSTGRVVALGPGEAHFTNTPTSPDDAADTFHLDWDTGLTYNQSDDAATAFGDVTGQRDAPLETSRLSGQLVRVTFQDAEPDPSERSGIGPWRLPATPASDPTPNAFGQLATLTVQQDAQVFTQRLPEPLPHADAERSEDDNPLAEDPRPASRFLLTGPRLDFDHAAETVSVPDAGTLLIEDYRQDDPNADAERNEASDTPTPSFSGRGATAFTWQGSLTLNAAVNEAVMLDDVQMRHARLLDDGTLDWDDVTQLDGQTLRVDLADTGGLAMWTSDSAPRPVVVSVACDDAVRLLNGSRVVEADYLRYTAEEHAVLLAAQPGNVVRVFDRDRPTGMTGRWLRWDLATDLIEGVPDGPAIIPITRD